MEPIQQLLQETRQSNRLLMRQLAAARLCAALLILLLVGAGLFAGAVTRRLKSAEQLVANSSLARMADAVAGLDTGALNQALGQLNGQLERLDVAALNDALANLNTAAQNISRTSEALQSLFPSFFAG